MICSWTNLPSTPHKSNRVWLHTLLHLLK
jgi:hypothetical protein